MDTLLVAHLDDELFNPEELHGVAIADFSEKVVE